MSAQGENVNGVVSLHKHITRLRTHIFLAGLDSEFNNARSEILQKDPPIDLKSSYAYVHRDHNQRQTMEEPKDLPDNTVLVAAQTRPQPKEKVPSKSSTYTCTHCGEVGHSKKWCYEIVGYSEWWDFNRKPYKKLEKAAIATSSVTKPSGDLDENSGMENLTQNDIWIIDTGATDHMTNSNHHLTSIRPSTQ